MIINNLELLKSTNENDNSFVGFKLKKNKIILYYPESLNLNKESKNIREDILNLLNTISLANKNNVNQSEIFENHLKDNDISIYSFLWTLNDYLKHGIYIHKEKQYKLNKRGKIDWKRTLDLEPIVSHGNVIYNNYVVSVPSKVDNILVDIHKYCVKKCIDFIGWIFNINSCNFNVKPCDDNLKLKYIYTLESEIKSTFDTKKRIWLRHLINVLRGLDTDINRNDFSFGTNNYHIVFEKMIDKVFGGIPNKKQYNPSGNWYIKENNRINKYKSSNLRPDTIYIDKSENQTNIYILDAKYYRFGTTGNNNDLPETTSIQKQITYGDFVKKINKDQHINIYNAFILPYDKRDNKLNYKRDLVHFGFAKATWNNDECLHETIHGFLIDMKHLIYAWNKSFNPSDINSLIHSIMSETNHVEVVCAIIENEDGKFFCCRRGPGRTNSGKWEFPGGKVEEHETHEETIIREIREELDSLIEPIEYVGVSNYTYTNLAPYNDFSITMYAYKCKLIKGNLELTEHTESKWCTKEEMQKMDFAEADKEFIK